MEGTFCMVLMGRAGGGGMSWSSVDSFQTESLLIGQLDSRTVRPNKCQVVSALRTSTSTPTGVRPESGCGSAGTARTVGNSGTERLSEDWLCGTRDETFTQYGVQSTSFINLLL